MNEELKALYKELGYTGIVEASEEVTRGDTEPEQFPQTELQPLDESGLKVIETLLKDKPEEILSQIKRNFSYPLTDDQIQQTLSEARRAFDSPGRFVEEIRAKRSKDLAEPDTRVTRGEVTRSASTIPDELILYPDIPIEPNSHKFEPVADALGWFFNSIYYILRDKVNPKHLKADFPLHSEFPGNFIYTMKNQQDEIAGVDDKITIALLADFGTGLYHSRYIARNIASLDPDYVIHLGDVYYAGRFSEFRYHFEEPLAPVLNKARVFTMNANHEMFSGAFPYFNYIFQKRNRRTGWVEQEQEGSYFCIRSEKYQIIGIDTAYHKDGRHPEQALNSWLGKRLREGKEANPKRINILLSPNEPYELGKDEFSGLYYDLEEFVREKLIDVWFWGNTHYCALFKPSGKAPFIGSCIGHGGHPIYKHDVEENTDKHQRIVRKNANIPTAEWVDLSFKFPKATGLRPDLGNHGFCLLELMRNSVKLTYYDWLKKIQYHTVIESRDIQRLDI